MKKTLLCASIAALAISCSSSAGYVINGSAAGEENGKTVYLQDFISGENIDSAVVTDGGFKFEGEVEAAKILSVGTRLMREIIVEQGSVIDLELVSKDRATVKDNGGLNGELVKYDTESHSYYEKMVAVSNSIDKTLEGEAKEKAMKPFSDLISERDAYQKSVRDANTGNLLGAFLVSRGTYDFYTIASLDSALNLNPAAKEFRQVKKARKALESFENTKEGKMFVDFKTKDVDGNDVMFSDYIGKGKYVLVDFWASWCGPCRGQIPNLKELHDKFNGKDFMVLGLNVWDKESEFHKAIEEEKMNWTHIYGSDNKVATDTYGVSGIPQIILFAPDGKVVYRNLYGDDMKAKVADILK